MTGVAARHARRFVLVECGTPFVVREIERLVFERRLNRSNLDAPRVADVSSRIALATDRAATQRERNSAF